MDFSTLFSFGIFLIAFLSLLLVGFQQMLNPLKENQARLESEIKEMKADIELERQEIKSKFEENDKVFRSFGILLKEIKEMTAKKA